MRQMAFWSDNKFPYVKYGEITQTHAGGCVVVEGVKGLIEPEFILPLAKGESLSQEIERNVREYANEHADFHQKKVENVGRLLTAYIDTKEFFTIGKLKP